MYDAPMRKGWSTAISARNTWHVFLHEKVYQVIAHLILIDLDLYYHLPWCLLRSVIWAERSSISIYVLSSAGWELRPHEPVYTATYLCLSKSGIWIYIGTFRGVFCWYCYNCWALLLSIASYLISLYIVQVHSPLTVNTV